MYRLEIGDRKRAGVKKLLEGYKETIIAKNELKLCDRGDINKKYFNLKDKFEIIKALKGKIIIETIKHLLTKCLLGWLKDPNHRLSTEDRTELKKYRSEIIIESLEGNVGKYTKVRQALKGTLGQKGNTFVENINFSMGESNFKIHLPTIGYLKICRAKKDTNNEEIVNLLDTDMVQSMDESLIQLQLMIPLANTGKIVNIECMEMFRMKLGGKKQDINTSLILEKFNWTGKLRLCATNETSDNCKNICYNVATYNSLFCDKCEKNTKWLSRFTPPKLLVIWENKITKIPKPNIEIFEVRQLQNPSFYAPYPRNGPIRQFNKIIN